MLTVYKLYFPFERTGTSLVPPQWPELLLPRSRLPVIASLIGAMLHTTPSHFSFFLDLWPSASGTSSDLTLALDSSGHHLFSLPADTWGTDADHLHTPLFCVLLSFHEVSRALYIHRALKQRPAKIKGTVTGKANNQSQAISHTPVIPTLRRQSRKVMSSKPAWFASKAQQNNKM